MSVEHSTLTGSDLHEPKGVASASTGQVYIANGSGSGAWTAHHNRCVLTVELANISAASSCYVATPIAARRTPDVNLVIMSWSGSKILPPNFATISSAFAPTPLRTSNIFPRTGTIVLSKKRANSMNLGLLINFRKAKINKRKNCICNGKK